MAVRHVLVSVAFVAAAVALPAVPSYAAGPVTDLYVGAGGSDSTNDCTSIQSPCATVQYAVDLADLSGTTIHVGAGTFDGPVWPGALGKSVAIEGVSAADTTLTNSGLDGFVVEVDSGTTSLSNLTAIGEFASTVLVDGTGVLDADHVLLETAGCVLAVFAGSATITDSTLQDGGHGGATCDPAVSSDPMVGDVAVSGGSVELVRTQVLSPDQGQPGVKVKGGTFAADQSLFDDAANPLDTNGSDGILVTDGTATITRSAVHGFGDSGVHTDGGTALLTDATFAGNVVGVTGSAGSTMVVRSTFRGELASFQGEVSVAGSLLGPDQLRNCANATITDLGYNLSTDDTCGFTASTSHEGVADLNLDSGLADRGGPVETVAILNPSVAVDTIPAGATYGASATPLCPATGSTDLRGVPRPVGSACDAGSMEMAGTTTTLTAPAKAKPHAEVTFEAGVDVPDVGVAGLEPPVGTVTFRSGSQVLCSDVLVDQGQAGCTTTALAAGLRTVTATFTPSAGSTIHPSTSAPRTLRVGTKPRIQAPGKVRTHVHERTHILIRASGSPAPRVTLVRGHLPRGLTFHRHGDHATITGRPTRAALGRHRLWVEATNLMGRDVHALTIVVKRR